MSRNNNNSVSTGCGCIEVIIFIVLVVICMGGVSINGEEYRIASCNCTDGLELKEIKEDAKKR